MYWYFSYQPRRYDCGGRCTARHRSWWSSFNPKKRNDEEAKVVWVCVIEIYYKYTILYIIWESSPHSLFSILKRRVIRLTPTAKPLTPTAKPWLSSKFLIPLHLPLTQSRCFEHWPFVTVDDKGPNSLWWPIYIFINLYHFTWYE